MPTGACHTGEGARPSSSGRGRSSPPQGVIVGGAGEFFCSNTNCFLNSEFHLVGVTNFCFSSFLFVAAVLFVEFLTKFLMPLVAQHIL